MMYQQILSVGTPPQKKKNPSSKHRSDYFFIDLAYEMFALKIFLSRIAVHC